MPQARSCFALIFLFCVTLFAGCLSSEQKFATHMHRAEKYSAARKHEEAYIELRNALKLKPSDSQVNFELAKNLQMRGHAPDAIFYYQEARRLDPANEEVALSFAGLLLGSDLAQADKIVDEVLAANPKNALAHVRKSEIALVRSDLAEALRWANSAIEAAPLDAMNHLQLGRVHRARIRKAQLAQEPTDPTIFAAAESAFKRTLEINPDLWNATFELARVYASWGGHQSEAKDAFRNAFTLASEKDEPGVQQVSLEALSYAMRIQDEDFERWVLEKTIETMPENLTVWLRYAAFEAQHGRSGEQVLRRLLDQQPDNVAAHVIYAKYLQDNKRVEEAIRHLDETAKSVENPEPVLGALVDLYVRQEQIDEARVVLDKMIKKYPSHARTRLARAEVLSAEHKYVEARDLLKDASIELDDANAWRLLALAEYNLRNFPDALKAIDKAAELSKPPTATILRLKSQILHASQDWTGTLEALRELSLAQRNLDPADLLRFAQALFELGKNDQGKQVLESLLRDDAISAAAAVEYAERFGKEDPKKARTLLEKAAARSPGNARLLSQLVQLDLAEGKKNAAIKRLRDSVSVQKDTDASTYLLLGRLLASENAFEEAQTYAAKAFARDPNESGVTKFLLELYFYLKKSKEVIPLFEAAEKAGKLSLANQHLLTQIWIGNDEPQKAETLLEKILEQNPNYAPAKNDLAYLLADRNEDLERALKLAESARRELANNPDSADTLGLVYLRKGLHSAALQQFRTALDLAKDKKSENPTYYLHLGQALRGSGDERGAAQAFEKALGMGQDFPGADTARRELEAAKAKTNSAE